MKKFLLISTTVVVLTGFLVLFSLDKLHKKVYSVKLSEYTEVIAFSLDNSSLKPNDEVYLFFVENNYYIVNVNSRYYKNTLNTNLYQKAIVSGIYYSRNSYSQ